MTPVEGTTGRGEDGREPARLQTYVTDGITVTFDPEACVHSGV